MTPERAQSIINARAAGMMVMDIISTYKVSADTVRKITGTKGTGSGGSQQVWTEERIERLKKLWSEGWSASQIAGDLGRVSRNAVLGKVHRLKLMARIDPDRQPRIRPIRKERSIPRSLKRNDGPLVIPASATASRPEPRPAPVLLVPECRRISLMELKETTCRWPLGDPLAADFAFCGGACAVERAYCEAHAAIAYRPVLDRSAA